MNVVDFDKWPVEMRKDSTERYPVDMQLKVRFGLDPLYPMDVYQKDGFICVEEIEVDDATGSEKRVGLMVLQRSEAQLLSDVFAYLLKKSHDT